MKRKQCPALIQGEEGPLQVHFWFSNAGEPAGDRKGVACLFSEEKARLRCSSFTNWAVRTPVPRHTRVYKSEHNLGREKSQFRLAPCPGEVLEGMSPAGERTPEAPGALMEEAGSGTFT